MVLTKMPKKLKNLDKTSLELGHLTKNEIIKMVRMSRDER